MTDAADHPYRKQKQSGGTFAAFVWLVSGVYLFWVHPTASFLSWQSGTYFIAGMFVATIVFGVTFYLVEHGLSKTVYNLSQGGSKGAATGMFLLAVLFMIIEAVVIFLVANWTVNWLHA